MFCLKMTYKYGNAIQKYHSIYVEELKYTITYFLNTISIVERVS